MPWRSFMVAVLCRPKVTRRVALPERGSLTAGGGRTESQNNKSLLLNIKSQLGTLTVMSSQGGMLAGRPVMQRVLRWLIEYCISRGKIDGKPVQVLLNLHNSNKSRVDHQYAQQFP